MAQQLIRSFLEDLVRVVDLPDPVVEFGALQVEADQDGDMRPLEFQRQYDAARGRVRIGVHNFPPRELLSAVARATPRLVRERLGRA